MQYADYVNLVHGGLESDVAFSGKSTLHVESRNLVEYQRQDEAVDEFLNKFRDSRKLAAPKKTEKTEKKKAAPKPKQKPKPKPKQKQKKKGAAEGELAEPLEIVSVDGSKDEALPGALEIVKVGGDPEMRELIARYKEIIS